MQTPKKRGFKSYLKRHLISIVSIFAAIVIAAGILVWYNKETDAKITQINSDTVSLTKDMDAKIKATLDRKAAELKAKQEAEAKAAAEKAQTADDSTAASFDSSMCNTATTHSNPSSIDVVVNKKHCMQPVTFAPSDLVTVVDSQGNSFLLSSKAATSFKAMSDAATAANQSFYLTSSYRSYSDQVSTYAYWVNTSGKAGADTYSARPGYSEHQTGLAFDVAATVDGTNYVLSDFDRTSQYAWLQAHAADYGFIQRYYAGYESITGYEAEEWHYRYVGVAVAKDMQAKGIKTLEQYWNISGGDYY